MLKDTVNICPVHTGPEMITLYHVRNNMKFQQSESTGQP